MASCWLNACIQLLLTAVDHANFNFEFYSELGIELLNIKSNTSIDPRNIKDIIAFAEDTRIALRKSEIMSQITEKSEQERQLRKVDQVHLNIRTGQQCVRDFFTCLNENIHHWIDVYEFIAFHTVDTTMCLQCNYENEQTQRQMYLEMEVPPNGSSLGQFVEEQLNGSYHVDYKCEVCNLNSKAEKRWILNSIEETNYITIILRRTVQEDGENVILRNQINAVEDIRIE